MMGWNTHVQQYLFGVFFQCDRTVCHLWLEAKQNKMQLIKQILMNPIPPTAPLCRFHYLIATCLFTLKSECIISVGNCLNNKELDSAEQQKQLTPRFKPPLALFLSITGWLAEWALVRHTHRRWGLTCTHTYLCSPAKIHNYKWTHSFYRAAYQV